MDQKIVDKALQRGREEETEVGFYMIGLIRDREAFVYDILEFPYQEQTGASVVSNPENLGVLFNAVPTGLDVVGIMHKHPSGIGPSFSSIDEQTFQKWGESKAHVIFSNETIKAFTVDGKEVNEIAFEARELPDLTSLTLNLPLRIKLFFPSNSKVLDIVQTLEKEITKETLKRLSPVKFKDKNIMERIEKNETLEMRKRNIVHVVSPNQKQFTYRFLVPAGTTFGEVREKVVSTLSLKQNVEFYTEEGRIHDKTPVSKLIGQKVYPRETLRDYLSRIVPQIISKRAGKSKEIATLKETINTLQDQIQDLEGELKEVKSKITNISEERGNEE